MENCDMNSRLYFHTFHTCSSCKVCLKAWTIKLAARAAAASSIIYLLQHFFFFSWALVRSWPFQPEHSSVIIPRAKGKITKVTKSKVIWAGDGDREWGNFCTLTLSRIERWSFIFKHLVLIHRVNKTLIPLFFYLNRINKSSKSTLLALKTQASIVLERGRFTLFILRLVAPHSQEIPLMVNMNSILASSF